jgi:1-acyl-sn-glycerol-3-phosphate acyltransferase
MLYGVKFAIFVAATIVLSLLTTMIGVFERHGKLAYQVNRLWTWIVLRAGGVTLKVEGLENLDARRPYIFMVNHQSNLDIPVLVQCLKDFQLRWIAKRELLWVPFFGWAMWATKHVIVDRSDRSGALGSLKRAQERIAGGISVVVFPEGTRSLDGGLQPFKRGGFLLAVKSKTPIVAVTINNSGRILPRGDWRVHGGTITVTISAPISMQDYRPGSLRQLTTTVEQMIAKNLRPVDSPGRQAGREPGITANSTLEERSV